jgi:hypothetical protein
MSTGPRLLAASLALIAPAAAAAAQASRYTRHDYEACRATPASEPGAAQRDCAGADGVRVRWSAGDDSSRVGFGPVERGAFPAIGTFFEAGRTIEWRGPAGGPARAAILRYRVGASVGRLDGSRLLVHRLGPDASCVVGVVDGARPAANEAARGIADGADGFACGRDRPVVLGRSLSAEIRTRSSSGVIAAPQSGAEPGRLVGGSRR